MSISVGSVAVDVVPDTRGFAADLKAKLKDITANIRVTADLTSLRAKLDEATRPRTATVDVDADTGTAEAQIDAVARDRRSSIEVGGLGSAVAGISGLGLGIAALGPALVPVTAAVAGLGAALVAPIAAAGGGLTIGALIAGKAIADTKKQQKEIADLATKLSAAKLAVTQATTPAGKKSAMEREAAAAKAYQSALAALTPAQQKFIDAEGRLKASFAGLVSSAGGAIFGPVIKGMDLLATILPKLKPLIRGVADGIGTLLTDVSKFASGPGFTGLMRSLGSAAQSSIVSFGRIFENVGQGLVGFFRAFAPLSRSFVGSIGSAARAFADWGTSLGSSKGFQSFLAYLKDVGPKVADTLGHIGQAVGKIAGVLAPLGTLSLELVDGLASFIATAKPAALAAIATAVGAIGLSITGLAAPTVALVALGVSLAGGFAYLVTKVKPLNDAFRGLSGWVAGSLLPALRDAWHTVLPGLTKGFDNVRQSVRQNQGLFRVLGDALKAVGTGIVKFVIPALAQFYRVELPLLGKAIGLVITGVRVLANGWLLMARAGLEGFKLLTVAALGSFGTILSAADAALGWIPKFGPKIDAAKHAFSRFRDGTVSGLDDAIGKVKDLQTELNAIRPKTIKVKFQVSGIPLAPTSALFGPGIHPEGAGARGAIINRPTVLLAGENNRSEALIPLDQTPGNDRLPSGNSGPQINIEQVVAQDANQLLRELQQRARHASLDGVRRWG